MNNSSGIAARPANSPCQPKSQEPKTIGQLGPRSVEYKLPLHGDGSMEVVRINLGPSSSGYSATDILKESIYSRFTECVGAAKTAKEKCAPVILKGCEALGIPSGSLYCSNKFNKVSASGRNIRAVRCDREEEGFSLKNALFGQNSYPSYLIYSTSSCRFNANGKMVIGERVPKCGDLALLYAKGLYGPGKKELAQCQSMVQLQEQMRLHGVDAWHWDKNRSVAPKESHVFHSSDFSKPMSGLVHRYWDMPCGERKVFLLESESVKNAERHAMVIMLEKKKDDVMVLRHYDPNWTDSCQKVILNNPDHAGFLDLTDLYRDEHVKLFFKHGVAKLNSLETVRDNEEADYYWYSSDNGQGGLRLSVKDGLWYRCKPKSDTPERSDYDQRREILEDDVVRIITEEVLVGNKSEVEKEAIIEYFLRCMRCPTFDEKIFPQLSKSNLSVGFKLRNLKDYCGQNYLDLLPKYPNSPEDLLGLDQEELKGAFRLGLTNNDPELAEFAVIASLIDDSMPEEERTALIRGCDTDLRDMDKELQRQLFPIVLTSNLSLRFKLKYFEYFFEEYQDYFRGFRGVVSESLCRESPPTDLADGLRLALYLNDVELAGNIIDMVLSNDEYSEEEKMAILDIAKTSQIPWELVRKNLDVVKRYLSGILESSLSDAHKVELSRMNKLESRSIICQLSTNTGFDEALFLLGVVVNSKLSPALKEKIVKPNTFLEHVAGFVGGPHDKLAKEMLEMLGQLIMENKNTGVAGA